MRKDESSENMHAILSEYEDSDEEEVQYGENIIIVVIMYYQNVKKRMVAQRGNSYVRKYLD